jgi:hypothetical protein
MLQCSGYSRQAKCFPAQAMLPSKRRLAVLLAHQRVAAATGAPFKIVFLEPGGVKSGGRVELAAKQVKLAYFLRSFILLHCS